MENLRNAIGVTRAWCSGNKIAMNNSKSGILVVKKRMHRNPQAKFIDEVPIVHSYKYLGINISESLRINLHALKIRDRLKGFSYFMRQLRPNLISLKTRMELWKTFFRCHLQYAAESCFADESTFEELRRLYTISLKRALHLP